jgi:hypothetical protein
VEVLLALKPLCGQADGYTMLITASTHAASAALYKLRAIP